MTLTLEGLPALVRVNGQLPLWLTPCHSESQSGCFLAQTSEGGERRGALSSPVPLRSPHAQINLIGTAGKTVGPKGHLVT